MILGLALGALGLALLRGAGRAGGRRAPVLVGWCLIAAAILAFSFALGLEVGAPTAIAVLSIFALALVFGSASIKPWRSRSRPAANDLSPARQETWVQGAARWLAAGPVGLVSAILLVSAITLGLGGRDGDALIFTMTASVIVWSICAAWAFSTRAPLRTAAAILGLGLSAGVASAAHALS